MCGIIAVLRARDDGSVADPASLAALLSLATGALIPLDDDLSDIAAAIPAAADHLQMVASELGTQPGMRLLVADRRFVSDVEEHLAQVDAVLARCREALDRGVAAGAVDDVNFDIVNAEVLRAADAAWTITRDRLGAAQSIRQLAGGHLGPGAVSHWWSIHAALSALDRLEVRGRDSAGLQVFVTGHGLDDATVAAESVRCRLDDQVGAAGAVRRHGQGVAFLYKTAAEIGELGDNTAALRSQMATDSLLQQVLSAPDAHVVVLGHTRWASVGSINQVNAHPLDSFEQGRSEGPYVAAVLNGDVDNFADLKALHGLDIAPEITTDAKVIPTLTSRALGQGGDLLEAFRSTVAEFEGSVAIAAHAAESPDVVALALRGSGQALYVGLGSDTFVVASEPYGVIEECSSYLRLEGETPSDPGNPVASRGQIVLLDALLAGTVEGIARWSYDGTALPVTASEFATAEITTRDIDRGDAPHFLLKEIHEAPRSFLSTLRGRIIEGSSGLEVRLGPDVVPPAVARALAEGRLRRILAVGQGTAAVAAQAIPHLLSPLLDAKGVAVSANLATEVSGFSLGLDMSDTLVIAISQSGTTTDTNRTVDLVRERGGSVIAVVNRRGSDLTDRADGVLYTSDGRDVEMSVASTKAFYAQVAAGALLSVALADAAGVTSDRDDLLRALRSIPQAMSVVLERRDAIGAAARRHAPGQRYWALVGNGPNRIAAREIRIKLSELCYKAISEDGTEDKKHIDLSSEPMIVVCAAGLTGSTADDVAKEVAIYRAHNAVPIVIATDGDTRFGAATELLSVPPVHPDLDFILAAMVGHLFGYEAALAIDALAVPLREMRSAVEQVVVSGTLPEGAFEQLARDLGPPAMRFMDGLRSGGYDGSLEAAVAWRLATVLRYALGVSPLETYQMEVGKVGRPGVVVEDLTAALTKAIDELTRPVDAIKHQAKTVTVGISRSDETLLQSSLVRAAIEAGAPRDRLSYRALRTLVALDPAVVEVLGYTRYRIEGDVADEASIQVLDRGGIARDIPSRTDTNPQLRGSKHRAAFEREVAVGLGGDGRSVIHVPEVKDAQTTGLTLLHCRFQTRLAADVMRAVLQGYRGRYGALKDAVTETEPTFRDDLLGTVDVLDLLTQPVYVLAGSWST